VGERHVADGVQQGEAHQGGDAPAAGAGLPAGPALLAAGVARGQAGPGAGHGQALQGRGREVRPRRPQGGVHASRQKVAVQY